MPMPPAENSNPYYTPLHLKTRVSNILPMRSILNSSSHGQRISVDIFQGCSTYWTRLGNATAFCAKTLDEILVMRVFAHTADSWLCLRVLWHLYILYPVCRFVWVNSTQHQLHWLAFFWRVSVIKVVHASTKILISNRHFELILASVINYETW